MVNPPLFIAAHPDDETLAMIVAIIEHVAAGQDVHLLWMTRGTASVVLGKLNGTSPTPNSWWGVMHNPGQEGYLPLTPDQFGQARIDEGTRAMKVATSGLPGTLTIHEAGLMDGQVTVEDAYDAILVVCNDIAPDGPVRLKGHTWVTQLDNHPDHIAVGSAIKQLGEDVPARFADRRYYILPVYWNDPDLNLVAETWDTPTNAAISARAINACRCYGAWPYAIGHHSTFGMFSQVMAGPKSLVHA